MTIDSGSILAGVALLTFIGGLIGVLWNFSQSVDKNTIVTQQILDQQQAQWKRIDKTGAVLDVHETRIVRLETWKEFHEEATP